MSTLYDVIVVGARCAGSPTAMLLARMGYRVLVVDRARFPSDTVSTHIVHPPGVAALKRWGLLDRLVATGCPPTTTYSFDFGPVTIAGTPGAAETPPYAYCPRRTILDQLLVQAAAEAGASVREGFVVTELLFDADRVVGIRGRTGAGDSVSERARVVIGADGLRSFVARAVAAPEYNQKPPLEAIYYSYWSGLPMQGRYEVYVRPDRGFGAVQTHDDLTLVVAGWPMREFKPGRSEIERNYLDAIERVPQFAERLRSARRESPLAGAAVPNFFRKPFGPGWVLVGDAGYNKDPITAQGISDAFRDAESCVQALNEFLSGRRSFDEAMLDYQRKRDDHVLPMYELTCQFATLAPPPPPMQEMLGAIQHDQHAMDQFVQMTAGSISPPEFFAARA